MKSRNSDHPRENDLRSEISTCCHVGKVPWTLAFQAYMIPGIKLANPEIVTLECSQPALWEHQAMGFANRNFLLEVVWCWETKSFTGIIWLVLFIFYFCVLGVQICPIMRYLDSKLYPRQVWWVIIIPASYMLLSLSFSPFFVKVKRSKRLTFLLAGFLLSWGHGNSWPKWFQSSNSQTKGTLEKTWRAW